MLGEGPTDYVICVFGTFGNELGLTFSKAKKKFWSRLHYTNINLPTQFCLKNINWKMSSQKKYQRKKMFMIFQLILMLLSIHKYWMVKNNTKLIQNYNLILDF